MRAGFISTVVALWSATLVLAIAPLPRLESGSDMAASDGNLEATSGYIPRSSAETTRLVWQATARAADSNLERLIPGLSLVWPLRGEHGDRLGNVSQDYAEFGAVVPGLYHTGLDISTAEDTPVVAAADGAVIFIQENDTTDGCDRNVRGSCEDHGFGTTIIVRHPGSESYVFTQYSHLSRVAQNILDQCTPALAPKFLRRQCSNPVPVTAGSVIAYSGATCYGTSGASCGGNHLHFELKSFATLGTEGHDAGDVWGYSDEHPDTSLFGDPVINFAAHRAQIISPSRRMRVLESGHGASLRVGPGNIEGREYRAFAVVSVGQEYSAVGSALGTNSPACIEGWIQITLDTGMFRDSDSINGRIPDGWICSRYLQGVETSPQPAELLAPLNSATLAGASQDFSWSAGVGVTEYWLHIGSTPAGKDLYNRSEGTARSRTVTGLPTDGRSIYLRLWSLVAGKWEFKDYIFTAANISGSPADLTSPDNGATLAGASQDFSWSAGVGVTEYWLHIGSTPGGKDLYNRSEGTARSRTVTGLPTDGRSIYLRLWSLVAGKWESKDYTFTAATIVVPKSDLVPQNISVPATVAPGASFNVSWTLSNNGSAAANSTSTTVVRINQSSTSAAGANLASIGTAALGAGASVAQNTVLSAPTTPGTYYVWVIADNNSQVTNQSNTGNDLQRSGSFTVR